MERHGYRGTPTYQTWICMKARCLRTTSSDYPKYGGRGIRICAEWASSFEAFLRDMGVRPDGKTLDRIDTNGDYCKENCRWASMKEQIRNTRMNRLLEYQGETLCLAEWAERFGMDDSRLSARLKRGWSMERALTTPKDVARLGQAHCQRFVTHDGETRNLKEWAASAGIDYQVFYARLRTGMAFEMALTKPVRKLKKRDSDEVPALPSGGA